ncbi:MAG: non-canonical purine NTP diphosphatase [Bacteroidota bacterium]
MKLIFATHNLHKLKEVKSLLPDNIQLLSLSDIDFKNEIEETEPTIEGNALLKARTIYQHTGINCFSDDSGLLVDALNGAPGVYSARYAGEQKNDQDNIQKLLTELKNRKNRAAHFKTVMALVIDGKEYLFEGTIKGEITLERHGANGFGYDPVFLPDGYDHTFAEMESDIKNKISHRAIALKKLVEFLGTSSVLQTPPSKEE